MGLTGLKPEKVKKIIQLFDYLYYTMYIPNAT